MMSSRRNRDLLLLLFTLKCILGNEASGGTKSQVDPGRHQLGPISPQVVGQLVQNHQN